MSANRTRLSSIAAWLLRLAATLVCLWVVFRFVDMEHMWAILRHANLGLVAVSALLYLLGALAGGWAWLVCLKALKSRINALNVAGYTLTGFVLNNLIPGGVAGDVYRVYKAVQNQVPINVAAASAVLERWASLVALLVSTLVADILAYPMLKTAYVQHEWAPEWLPSEIFRFDIVMGLVLALLCLVLVSFSYSILRHFSPKASEESQASLAQEANRLGADWKGFLAALTSIKNQPRAFFLAAAINLLSPVLEGLSYAFAAAAIGLELSPYLFLAFTPLFRIITHLPVSVNAIGPQEIISLLLWQPLGASTGEALAVSLMIHAIRLALSCLGLPLLLVDHYPGECLPDKPSTQ